MEIIVTTSLVSFSRSAKLLPTMKLFIALFLYTATIAIADVSLLNKEYLPPFPYFKTIYKIADSSSIFTSDSSFLSSEAAADNFNGDFEKFIDVDAPAIDSTKTDATDSTDHNVPISISTKSNSDDSESSLETENTAGSTGESSFSVSSILPEPGSFLSRLSIGSSASGSLTPVTSDDILSFSSSSSVQEDTKTSDEETLSSNADSSEDTSFRISKITSDSGSLTSSLFTESSTTDDLNTDTSATHISDAVTTSSSSSPLPKDDSNISVTSSTTVTTSSDNSTNDNSSDLASDTNIATSGDKSAPAITISTKSSDSELNDSSSNSDNVGTVYAAGGGYIY